MQDEFLSWQDETLKAIELWTIRLKNEALKQKTYSSAINFLKQNRPGLPHSYQGSAQEQFQSVVRSMFDEATRMVIDEANKQVIKHKEEK